MRARIALAFVAVFGPFAIAGLALGFVLLLKWLGGV